MTGAALPLEIRGRVLRGCRLRAPEMNDDYAWLRNVRCDFNRLGLSKVITDLSALTWRATYRAPRSFARQRGDTLGYVRARGAW